MFEFRKLFTMKIIFLLIFLKFILAFAFDCGISSLAAKKYDSVTGDYNIASDKERVLGGDESVEYRWPWIADLGINKEGFLLLDFDKNNDLSIDDFFQICTATIIQEKWILTATHCVNHFRKFIQYLKS